MAKVAFTKLGLSVNKEVKTLEWNGQVIEVKQYLPVAEKLELVSNIINQSVDDNGYYNTARVEIYLTIGVIEAYTNINFTEKQKEDVFGLYDKLVSSGLCSKLRDEEWLAETDDLNPISPIIPYNEWGIIENWTYAIIKNIYKYKDSIMGILDTIQTDYSNLNLDSETIRQNLGNPENLQLLRDTLTKLG